jgi:heme O synthase-like polyprenyltransferase
MNAMAWLAHRGLVQDWFVHARRLKRMADWFKNWGSDAGAMHVTVGGLDAKGQACQRGWVLMAARATGLMFPRWPPVRWYASWLRVHRWSLAPGLAWGC